MSKELYIIDGYGLIYRSYFAFISRPLKDHEGNNVSALFGFFNTLLMVLREYPVDYVVVAMDTAAPTFRHQLYPSYKANRDKAPEDLHTQVPRIQEILDAAGIPHIGIEGVEADDVIASLIACAKKQGIKSMMVTGDKDLLQLVSPETRALRPPKKGEKQYRVFGPEEVVEEFGITAEQIIDYLALIGDSSDNIPGVAGIGPKGALKLLQEFGTLEHIYEHLDDVSASIKEKLLVSKELAFLSKTLVTLRSDVIDIPNFSANEFRTDTIDWSKAVPFFEQAQAKSLIAAVGEKRPTSSIHISDQITTVEAKKGTYRALITLEEVSYFLDEATKHGIISFDFETDNIDEMVASPVGFSFSYTPYEAYYVPILAERREILPKKEVLTLLKTCLVDNKTKIIGQNLKYDYKILARLGIVDVQLHFDTMIAAWMIDASSGIYNLDYLAEKYIQGYRTIHFSDVVKGSYQTFSDVPLQEALAYAAEDADIAWRLYTIFSPMLEEKGVKPLFEEVEMPLVKILSHMELYGIKLDVHALQQFDTEIVKRVESIEEKIYQEVGHEFNINSPKQLQQVLFEERGLPTKKKNKTGYSTALDTLEQLAPLDIIPQLIVQNRALVKLKNTYVDALPPMVLKESGRIHTSFIQTGTATGRLSSRNPNLQNIPIRSDDGRRIRNAFIPEKNSLLLSADYTQIELVVLAHLSDDPGLKEAFLRNEDIHNHTASLIFSVHPELVLPEQRRIAKTINFGVMYGMSAFRLSNELTIPRKEAQSFIDSYFSRFSHVQAYMQQLKEQAEIHGYITTLLGRRRPIPEIQSRNKMEKSQAERIVVNTAIQGSAADIMKLAMIQVVKQLEKTDLRSKLLLQVHDELIFEVPQEEKEEMITLVRNTMEHAYTLSVPLRVSIETGDSWGGMH